MSRGKVTVEEQIEVAKACAEGRMSKLEAARRLGVSWTRINEWVARYKFQGELAFRKQEHNTVYSEELKSAAVKEYLSGNGPQTEIAAKYGLRSTRQLREWIKVYNSGRDFGRKMSGGSRMKQGRKTTEEEKLAIKSSWQPKLPAEKIFYIISLSLLTGCSSKCLRISCFADFGAR